MMMKNKNTFYESSVISGPTRSHGMPMFSWTNTSNAVQQSIRGMPEQYDFPFLSVKTFSSYNLTWKQYQASLPSSNQNGGKRGPAWVWGTAFGVAIVLFVIGATIWKKRQDQKEKESGMDNNRTSGVQEGEYKQVV